MAVDLLEEMRRASETFRLAESELPNLRLLAQATLHAIREGGTLFACGNGGSSAQALHLVEELTGRFKRDRPPLRAMVLGADAPALTCTANDFGYEEVFSRPLKAFGTHRDILVAFSTSGNSENIMRVLLEAKRLNLKAGLLTGCTGGRAAMHADIVLRVPSDDTARIQEVHTFYLHAILSVVEDGLFHSS